jgi:SAM-dependent methyltransferase
LAETMSPGDGQGARSPELAPEELEARLARLEARERATASVVETLQREVKNATRAAAQRARELEQLRESTSWRITAPLRLAKNRYLQARGGRLLDRRPAPPERDRPSKQAPERASTPDGEIDGFARIRDRSIVGGSVVELPNFVAVQGMPNSGKTSAGCWLAGHPGVKLVMTDELFFSDILPLRADRDEFTTHKGEADEHFNVYRYVFSEKYDFEQLARLLRDRIEAILAVDETVHTVVLEGFAMKDHERIFFALGVPQERVQTLLAQRTHSERFTLRDCDVTGKGYEGVWQRIQDEFRKRCIQQTLPKAHYQSFDMLGSKSQDSKSAQKFAASGLDDLILPESSVVDIGCNAGYFCFRAADRTTGQVIGVDSARHSLELGSELNSSVFRRTNVDFVQADAHEFLRANPGMFDVIHCASTFHYFREAQAEFLELARGAIRSGGSLVLEVELGKDTDKPETHWLSRGVDATPCAFPNRAMFELLLRDLFTIVEERESTFQAGSFHARHYFHLEPV